MGFERRALVQFDLSQLVQLISKSNITIDNISISLYMSRTSQPDAPANISIHTVFDSWNEGPGNRTDSHAGKGNCPASPGDVTWKYSNYQTALWKSEGGDYIEQALCSAVKIFFISSYVRY